MERTVGSSSATARWSFPTQRSKHVLDTESTDVQSATEDECAPFFVDLESLSEGQLDHLRSVGLLPPLPVRARRVTGKAAKLLGEDEDDEEDVDDDDDDYGTLGRPRIELLDETNTTTQPDHGLSSNGLLAATSSPPFDPYAIRLLRAAHAHYLSKALLDPLPRGFVSLDASHPWMAYWCLHSLDLLGHFDDGGGTGGAKKTKEEEGGYDAMRDVEEMQKGHLLRRIVSTLEHCWMDVALEFDADDAAGDARLERLHREQKGGGSNNGEGMSSGGKKALSITGGGFGGGPHQMPHCAPTYAAVLSLAIVSALGLERPVGHPYREAGRRAMEVLTRRRLQLYAFFLTLREEHEGGQRTAFRMQHDGEIDVRASYCILAPCHLMGLLDESTDNNSNTDKGAANSDEGRNTANNPLLSPSIPRYIASCQTFEGGFGAEPHNEAHGGYTFCALAALRILGSVPTIDVGALSSWLARRQMGYEGGFQGRTNKLVDGCYSFWQGGAVAVLDGWYDEDGGGDGDDATNATDNELSFDEVMLQRYILLCAQDVNGGLRDKPSKPKDFYHSCYNLSGLSVAQHALEPWPPSSSMEETVAGEDGRGEEKYNRLFGDINVNIVGRTDPLINIRVERVRFMRSQRFVS